MAIHRDSDRTEPAEGLAGVHELRRATRTGHLASGTLACPACDAPVAPGPAALTPTDGIGCPVCAHEGVVRDFLSLAEPTRPARVNVRVVRRRT